MYTYECVASAIVKFADDMVMIGLISNNDKGAYLEKIKHLEDWCLNNNLHLNVSKLKDLIVDYSNKQDRNYHSVVINEKSVERVDNGR